MNIVKDDLIVKVDELAGEIEILREELNAVNQSRNKLRQKLSEVEDELKKTKDQVKQQSKHDNYNACFVNQSRITSKMHFNLQPIPIKKKKVMFQWLNESVSLEWRWPVCSWSVIK